MKRLLWWVGLLTLFAAVPTRSFADEELASRFWKKGLHLLAGAGPSSSLIVSTIEERDAGIGPHLKTDLSYVMNEKWAAEWSSRVDFNQVDDVLLWNSQLTMGVRYHIAHSPFSSSSHTFIRAFVGAAPTAIYFYGERPANLTGVDRIHFNGPVVGFSTGQFHETSGGTTWFHELSTSAQRLDSFDAIKLENDVPVVVQHENTRGVGSVYMVNLTLGLLIF